MNDRQNAKLNMAQRVSDVLAAYVGMYSGIVPVTSAVTALNANISGIREVESSQASINVPASTQEKREAENRMIESSVKMANTLYVIGFSTDNKVLTNLLGLSPSSFYRVEDNSKLALAKQIYTLAQAQAQALAEYGVDAQEIAATGATIEAYRALIGKPMYMVGERKQKTTNLKQLFAELDSILYDKLDKLIVLFKSSAPDFYDEYRTARNFINTSVRHQKND